MFNILSFTHTYIQYNTSISFFAKKQRKKKKNINNLYFPIPIENMYRKNNNFFGEFYKLLTPLSYIQISAYLKSMEKNSKLIEPIIRKPDIRTKARNQVTKKRKKSSQPQQYNTENNGLVKKILEKSRKLDGVSSSSFSSDDSSDVLEIDPLFINGRINNVREIDEQVSTKHKVMKKGLFIEVNDYEVLLVGRPQFELREGMEVGIFAPPAYKSAKCPQTNKITIIIERKQPDPSIKNHLMYPFLIVHPSTLLYPTYLCSWIECKRRITLQHYIEYNSSTNKSMVYGNVIHHYLEKLVRKELQAIEPTEDVMKELYSVFLYEMYLCDVSFEVFSLQCDTGVANVCEWYIRHVVKGEVIQLNKWEKLKLKITRVIGSEIMLRSRYFGVKGKVDAIFQGMLSNEKTNKTFQVYLPFELKTGGKVMDSHRKQLQYYVLLARETFNSEILGLLYYSELNILQYRNEDPIVCYENLNIRRNSVVVNSLNLHSDKEKYTLPKIPTNLSQCKFCNLSLECLINQPSLPDIQEAPPLPSDLNPDLAIKMASIPQSHLDYIHGWMQKIHYEEIFIKDEDKAHHCKGGLGEFRIMAEELDNLSAEGKAKVIIQRRLRDINEVQALDTLYRVGEKVRMMIELIKLVESCRIVKVQKDQRIFKMTMELANAQIRYNVKKTAFLREESSLPFLSVQVEKFIDKTFTTMRASSYSLVLGEKDWLKKLIIDGKQQKQLPSQAAPINEQDISTLNQDQKQAFIGCVNSKRFHLVEGMPGTGKTQLIMKLMHYFYQQNKRILITSFTNQALSNIMFRQTTLENKIPPESIIREGSQLNISSFAEYTHYSRTFQTIDSYKEYFSSKKVWFVTMSSLYIQHVPLEFDIVIVDEASQCLEPTCLQALIRAEKFILIGDAKQLRPIVKAPKAESLGMGKSLFQKFNILYPHRVSKLKKQYRMHEKIMKLSNQLVYEGDLQPATQEVSQRTLQLSENWDSPSMPDSLRKIIDPKMPVRFVNYDPVLNLFSSEPKLQTKTRRFMELELTCSIYQILRKNGLQREEILIISAFNSTVHEIVSQLKKRQLISENKGDVLTIDRSQGSDKEVIVLLFQRGNEELVENPRRLNVALTRAKNKFIIIGSQKYIKELSVWTGKLAKLLSEDQVNINSEFIESIVQK